MGREADGEAAGLDRAVGDPAGDPVPWPTVPSTPSGEEHPAASIRAPTASAATAPRRAPAPVRLRATRRLP
ncbi:hypothetical protein [Streptomyces brevispora]|uniref:Uncharacterized protein n=1 Tax=Streptomyces brevispora TaxID=887462 RepID=A0ABZ1G385_9ACTN|nr:hypothetical protein [Streptomyces brevispora]WSC13158.1 hypothetical protein OIE64_10140 [Streptomyces brevispora]